MSATNRNGLVRHPGDFYETPAETIDLLLTELGLTEAFEGYVVDPGSGNGAIAGRVADRCPRADVRGIELQPELLARAQQKRSPSIVFELGNFLTWQPDGAPDLIVGNPPYQKHHWDPDKVIKKKGKDTGARGGLVVDDPDYAAKFVARALEIVSKRGTVAMLLRDNFLVPQVRRPLRLAPCDLFRLERRPSFNGSGCDATDYAWHVWGPKRGSRWKVLSPP